MHFIKLYLYRWSVILHVRWARHTQSSKLLFLFFLFFCVSNASEWRPRILCLHSVGGKKRVKFETAKPINKILQTHRANGGRELSPSEQITDARCHIDLSLFLAINRDQPYTRCNISMFEIHKSNEERNVTKTTTTMLWFGKKNWLSSSIQFQFQ